jgi:hypothetical protein
MTFYVNFSKCKKMLANPVFSAFAITGLISLGILADMKGKVNTIGPNI